MNNTARARLRNDFQSFDSVNAPRKQLQSIGRVICFAIGLCASIRRAVAVVSTLPVRWPDAKYLIIAAVKTLGAGRFPGQREYPRKYRASPRRGRPATFRRALCCERNGLEHGTRDATRAGVRAPRVSVRQRLTRSPSGTTRRESAAFRPAVLRRTSRLHFHRFDPVAFGSPRESIVPADRAEIGIDRKIWSTLLASSGTSGSLDPCRVPRPLRMEVS